MTWRRMRAGLLCSQDNAFAAGNQSVADIYALLQAMAAGGDDMSSPAAGGTLEVNSQALGSYDYVIKDGNQTVSSFTAGDWFTATEDSRSAFIVVKGNLTINGGQTFVPSVRKLFTAIYVTGDLAISGAITMTARGADHSSATGSNVSAAAILIATGTFSAVVNPQVAAAGGTGGTGPSVSGGTDTAGDAGDAGANGQTGGGGSGGANSSGGNSADGGDGATGTSFGGGPGGGGSRDVPGTGQDAASDGGPGGPGASATPATTDAGGGAGNPGGAGDGDNAEAGDNGTGGVLFIICDGELSGAGTVSANGSDGGSAVDGGNTRAGGGGSGGGSVTILYGTDTSSITPTAAGGAAGDGGTGVSGGAGGAGTARKLEL